VSPGEVFFEEYFKKHGLDPKSATLLHIAPPEWLPALARERFVPISEDYDLGHVEAGYRDLHDLRERAYQQLTQRVTPRDADFTLTATLDAPPADVYAELVKPSTMQRVAGAPNITLKSGARGTLANAAYHCEHGANRKSIFEVIRDDPPRELTMWIYGDGPEAYATYTFEPLGADRTRDVAERVGALVPVRIGIRERSRAHGIQHDHAGARHAANLSR